MECSFQHIVHYYVPSPLKHGEGGGFLCGAPTAFMLYSWVNDRCLNEFTSNVWNHHGSLFDTYLISLFFGHDGSFCIAIHAAHILPQKYDHFYVEMQYILHMLIYLVQSKVWNWNKNQRKSNLETMWKEFKL